MKNILRKFIYFVLILSLAIPVSTVFEAITFNEVYAQKKERKKPPKARRTVLHAVHKMSAKYASTAKNNDLNQKMN